MNSTAFHPPDREGPPHQLPMRSAPYPPASPRGMMPRQGPNVSRDRRPPPRLTNPAASSSGWDSASRSPRPRLNSPISPDYSNNSYPIDTRSQSQDPRYPPPRGRRGPPGPPPLSGPPRARTAQSPSRGPPLASKVSLPDMRTQEGGRPHYSRPRNGSMHQPLGGPYSQSPLHPPSAHHAPPGTPPWERSRHASVSSTHSSATHASAGPPRSPGALRNGPPQPGPSRNGPPQPGYPIRPPFGYNHRVNSSHSNMSGGGAHGPGPWLGGEEVRSSFRSQRTVSTNPGTMMTERSSVMTGRTSVTTVEPNPDEPSIDDVMDMYRIETDGEEASMGDVAAIPPVPTLPSSEPLTLRHEPSLAPPTSPARLSRLQRLSINVVNEEASLPTNLMDRNRRASGAAPVDNTATSSLRPPSRRTDIDAEIRRSKLLFASADFRASIPHLIGGLYQDDEEEGAEKEKRDSGKSIADDDSPLSEKRSTASSSIPYPQSTPSHSMQKSPQVARSHPRPIVDDDPGSRDRYGFKKESQYISRKEYDSWNRGYSEYLARRKKKWVAFLKESSLMTDEPNRFPALSPKTRRFVRKGIPPEWRGAAWFYYAGGPSILSQHAGLYDQLLYQRAKRVDVEAIERDLHRTFPDNIKFKPPGTGDAGSGGGGGDDKASIRSDDSGGITGTDDEPAMISALRRVLWAFSIYNPHIGYCQSLNFIAGMLLLFVETEEQTFWLLNVITRIYLPGTHEMSLEGSKVDLSVLMTELRASMPNIWDKIGGELDMSEPAAEVRPQTSRSLRRPTRSRRNLPSLSSERLPPITLSMTAWFMSCYIGTLPVETALRVWDVFFCEGSKTLFNIALAIFKQGEADIKAVKDPMEMFGVVQSMPRRMIDANGLMEACFKKKNGISSLTQGTIEARRQERRAKAQLERQQHMSTPNGRMTNEDVQRKGTFGKKRSTSRMR